MMPPIPEVPASTLTKVQIQALNPETAALWIVGSSASLTKAQYQTLVIACRDGGYVQDGTGVHNGVHNGHLERVSAPALGALIRQGYLNPSLGSEGRMGGWLSKRSLARLANSKIEYGL